MGYTTDFEGQFTLDKPLTPAQAAYLKTFSETRRMKRDAAKAEALSDPLRQAVFLPIGEWGQYFVGGLGFMGQDHDPSVLDLSEPPPTQPGLWCQWVPTEAGTGLAWDGGEKFYEYVPWLKYLIQHFLVPWGYVLNGQVTWQGEEDSDAGVITCTNNVVTTQSKTEILAAKLVKALNLPPEAEQTIIQVLES